MSTVSELSLRSEIVKRIREWYRWQLSISDKKKLLRNFKEITRRVYKKSKVLGLEAFVIRTTTVSLGNVLESDPIQATLFTRLTDIFYQDITNKSPNGKTHTLPEYMRELDSVIRIYDYHMREHIHAVEKRRLIYAMRKHAEREELAREKEMSEFEDEFECS